MAVRAWQGGKDAPLQGARCWKDSNGSSDAQCWTKWASVEHIDMEKKEGPRAFSFLTRVSSLNAQVAPSTHFRTMPPAAYSARSKPSEFNRD